MRFIGNKEKLLEKIYHKVVAIGIKEGSFCDFFAGTANVGKFFKEKGFDVTSSDILYFSYVLQRAYVENNQHPKFTKLLNALKIKNGKLSAIESVREYLNKLPGVDGFIYKNYTEEGTKNGNHTRKYFVAKNGKKIDAIRTQIEEWKSNNLISENEYFILLALLIESVPFYANISGVYAAFLKKYDPRALKNLQIKPINLCVNGGKHIVHNKNSMELINKINTDVLYIDPPYNNRQYAPNYHLLETIAKYDDPQIKGVSGMRDYTEQKSEFCNKNSALLALEKIAKTAKYKVLILSYNSEGIMSQKDIISILQKYGNVEVNNIDYPRFKSNSNGNSKHMTTIQEQLYVLTA